MPLCKKKKDTLISDFFFMRTYQNTLGDKEILLVDGRKGMKPALQDLIKFRYTIYISLYYNMV